VHIRPYDALAGPGVMYTDARYGRCRPRLL